jgi:uncharacterized protein YuzE
MHLTIQTDTDNDILYVSLSKRALRRGAVARSQRIDDDISLDFDANDRLVGLEVMNASARVGKDWTHASVDELIGAGEAATIVGVNTPNLVRDHASRADFPKPAATLPTGRLWLRGQVQAYADARRKSPKLRSA